GETPLTTSEAEGAIGGLSQQRDRVAGKRDGSRARLRRPAAVAGGKERSVPGPQREKVQTLLRRTVESIHGADSFLRADAMSLRCARPSTRANCSLRASARRHTSALLFGMTEGRGSVR